MLYKVYITHHALTQWRKRVGTNTHPEVIARWVSSKIRSHMLSGIKFNHKGASRLRLCRGLVAVIAMNKRGPGWAVLTFTVSGNPERLRLPG